jgi:hypothetical protein
VIEEDVPPATSCPTGYSFKDGQCVPNIGGKDKASNGCSVGRSGSNGTVIVLICVLLAAVVLLRSEPNRKIPALPQGD